MIEGLVEYRSISMKELEQLLKSFKLNENQIEIYFTLLRKGSLTATELTKITNIPKTTVYRELDGLIEQKVVNEVVGETGKLFEVAPFDNFKYMVAEEKKKAQKLEDALPEVIEGLSQVAQENVAKSKIKYYTGVEGLKQVTWNSSKAKDTLRIFEIKDMSAFLNYDFCELTRMEFVKNGVMTHELTNEVEQPGWTNVTEMVEKYWDLRYVDPKELKMEFEMLVYNDVYVMYNYQDDEIFCAEIYNERLARMQKQIFDFIWLKATKMEVVDKHGASRLGSDPGINI